MSDQAGTSGRQVDTPTGDREAVPLWYRYGCHRVVEPLGSLPQAALRLESDPDAPGTPGTPDAEDGRDWEIVLEVETLNVDSASFRQLEGEVKTSGGGGAQHGEEVAAGIALLVQRIVRERGKLHNPVTGSGGMLLGRVRRVGAGLVRAGIGKDLQVGERVATLVSLTLTPLVLEEVRAVHLLTHQVEVRGTAVLFASGAWAKLPDFLPERVALSALDVAGAAPQVARLLRSEKAGRVLILGCGGKSGLLCAAAARRCGAKLVVGLESGAAAAQEAEELGACQVVLRGDARDGLGVAQAALAAAGGAGYDLVVSCVNVDGAEMAAILSVRDRGKVYFFSMATSFTRAALGAEGVSQDVDMLVGNGYCAGHAAETLELLRHDEALRRIFIRRYA